MFLSCVGVVNILCSKAVLLFLTITAASIFRVAGTDAASNVVAIGHLPEATADDTIAIGVGTNNEDSIVTTSSKQSVASPVGIPQGPTINPIGHYDQKAQRSYADVVRDNRSTHSIELIK